MHRRFALATTATLLLAGLTAVAGPSAVAAPHAGTPGAEQAMRAAADGTVTVERDGTTGRATFVRTRGHDADLAPGVRPPTGATGTMAATAKSDAWLAANADVFGIDPDQLVLADTTTDAGGRTLTWTQRYRGVPVFGSTLRANLDDDGDLLSVNGYVVPDLSLDTTPTTSAADASAAARSMVRADPPTDEDGTPTPDDELASAATSASLVVYETGAIAGQSGATYLAWLVTVTAGTAVSENVVLDARRLKPLNRWSGRQGALDRELRETTSPATDSQATSSALVWQEGDALPGTLSTERQNLLATSQDAYWFFRNAFGRDSYDGQGAAMVTIDNGAYGCPNASWMGSYIWVCPGVATDDIVAHEWGHAYTEHTSALVYQWQAGALNESYSDVWGETVDLIDGREDETEDTAARTPGDCSAASTTGASVRGVATIDAPASIARTCTQVVIGSTSVGVDRTPQQISVVVGRDAANGTGPTVYDGCSTLTNASAVSGRWAYLDRSPASCGFATKIANAKAAGAIGVVLGNSTTTALTTFDPGSTFPAIAVSQSDGTAMKSLASGTVITMTVARGGLDASTRWLVGEQSTAFGSAIRDMWNPDCIGDPSSVTDANYTCTDSDSGGVHTNSNVANHAYALFVDGGESGGSSYSGVGLDKAAAVWWRAGASYLTPISDFADFADALDESCQTLVGAPLTRLSTTPSTTEPLGQTITTADCATLDTVIAATGLRTDPVTRCNLTPTFTAGEPDLSCGTGTTKTTLVDQDFESGLGSWTTRTTPTATGTPGPTAWTTSTTSPGGTSRVAAAINTNDCSSGSIAGRASLLSPVVQVGTDAATTLLRFRHQVALEDQYDGANVSISINGGAFALIPAAAWVWNGPTTTVSDWPAGSGAHSDNPLLGQKVWIGQAQTLATGWGVPIADLTAAGADPGDSVQLRFDLGTDECTGYSGWYVDDISITECLPDPAATPSATPTPTATATATPTATTTPSASPTASTTPTTKPTVRRASRTSVSVTPKKPRRLTRVTLRATVTPATTGTVTFWVDGRKAGTATVRSGHASLKVSKAVARRIRAGKHAVRASFSGSATVLASTGSTTFRARR